MHLVSRISAKTKLQLFRILNKNDIDNKIDCNNKQPVFFQHGLLDSSDAWICNYEKNCLPYIMCKKGFDVVRHKIILLNL